VLIEAGEELLAKADLESEAQRLFEESLRQLEKDPAATTDERRLRELEELARAAGGRAYSAAARAGAADPWPPIEGARELVALAEHAFGRGLEAIESADGSGEEVRLRTEAERLRGRLDRLSSLVERGRYSVLANANGCAILCLGDS
jgi:hypothetical protein